MNVGLRHGTMFLPCFPNSLGGFFKWIIVVFHQDLSLCLLDIDVCRAGVCESSFHPDLMISSQECVGDMT